MNKDDDIAGLGGWLGILIAWMILGGVAGGSQAAGLLLGQDSWELRSLYFALQLLLAVAILGAAFALCSRSAQAVWIAISVFWLLPVVKIAQVVILKQVGDADVSEFIGRQIFATIALAVLVTAYLKRSVRVRNTYGRNG